MNQRTKMLGLIYLSTLSLMGAAPVLTQVSTKTVVVGALLYNYEGLEAGGRGHLTRAKELFQLALQFEPHYPPTLLNLQIYFDAHSGKIGRRQAVAIYRALDRFSSNDSSSAIGLADRAVKHDPHYGPAALVRAMLHERLAQLEPAKADYDQAVELAPKLSLTYYFRGKFYSAQGQSPLAVSDLTRALERDQNLAPALMERGMAYHALGEHDLAVKDFEIALKAWPKWQNNFKVFSAFLNRGIDNIEQQDFQQAVADLNRAISLNPRFSEAYLNRGIALAHLKSYSLAIDDLDHVLSMDPESVEARFQRGVCLQRKGDFEQAVASYLETVRLDPEHVQAYFRLGEIYARTRELESAIAIFDRVLALAPATYWAYYRKAVACDKAKEWENAIASYNAFIEIAPEKHVSHKEFARERVKKLVRWAQK